MVDEFNLKKIIRDNLSEYDFNILIELKKNIDFNITVIDEVKKVIEQIENEAKKILIPEVINKKRLPMPRTHPITGERSVRFETFLFYEGGASKEEVDTQIKSKNRILYRAIVLKKVRSLIEYYSEQNPFKEPTNFIEKHLLEREKYPNIKYTAAMKDYYFSILSNTDQMNAAVQTLNFFYPNADAKSVSVEGFLKQVNKQN